MSRFEQSPEHLSANISLEALHEGARTNVINESRERQLGMVMGMDYARMGKILNGPQPSAPPATWEQFRNDAQELARFSDRRKEKEEFLGGVASVLSEERFNALPGPTHPTLKKSGMQARVMIDGKIEEDRRDNEQSTMRDIHEKVERAMQAAHEGRIDILRRGNNYLAESEGTIVVNRSELERDLRWLEDDKRIGPNADYEGRQAYFLAYKNVLEDLVMLNNAGAERYFRKKSGSILSNAKMVERVCSGDPNGIKNASKFALLLATSALLALWVAKDIGKKTVSVATMVLLGGVMYLASGRSKMNYIVSNEYLKATQEGLNGAKMEDLYAFAKRKPRAFKAMMDRLREFGPGGIPENKRHLLTEPKKNGKLLRGEIVDDEAIVDMMIGRNHPPLSVLEGIYNTRMSKSKDVAINFAEANSKSRGQTADELNRLTAMGATPDRMPESL